MPITLEDVDRLIRPLRDDIESHNVEDRQFQDWVRNEVNMLKLARAHDDGAAQSVAEQNARNNRRIAQIIGIVGAIFTLANLLIAKHVI